MKTAVISKACGEINWERLPKIEINEKCVKDFDADISTFAQICYDENAFYLHFSSDEHPVRAEVKDPLGETCEDSCMEFFFRPDPSDMRYFNFEFNPALCPFIGFGRGIAGLIRLFPRKKLFCPKACVKDDGWELYYSIPFSFVRQFFPDFAPHSGEKILANFYKCGEKTEKEHYYCWSTPADRECAFHCPEFFCELVFE